MTDITALLEDMRALADAVPVLTEKVGDTRHEAEALQVAAEELQRDVDAARAEAATRLTALRAALPEVTTLVDAGETQLREADTAVHHAWLEAEPILTRAGDGVVNEAGEILTHAQELRNVLGEAGVRLDQSQAVGEAAIARLEQNTEEAEKRLETALQALKAQIQAFAQLMETANEAITDAARDLIADYSSKCAAAEVVTAHAEEALTNQLSAHKDAAGGLLSELAQALMERVDEGDGEIEAAVTVPLGSVESRVELDLDTLGSEAVSHEAELARHGQALEQAFGHLSDEATRLPVGIGHIQQAAVQLGVA